MKLRSLLFLLVIISAKQASAATEWVTYALPGAEYIHKLVFGDSTEVVSVDLGELSNLQVRCDRETIGNKYKYVYGKAPEKEGEYRYTVHRTRQGEMCEDMEVRLVVNKFLQQPRPMMSWLTWNWFARSISHEKMVEIAKGMKERGLIDAGFQTIVLDDAWAEPTADKSALTYDSTKFPQGIRGLKTALQDIDGRLHVGIYSDAGAMTCENYQPGSYGYEAQHLALFESWGVDMLKYDYCNSEASTIASYSRMGEAIEKSNEQRKASNATPFIFNICEWGSTDPWLWATKTGGSSWRCTADAREDWIGNRSRPGVLGGVDVTRRLWMYAGVNRFNDLDMMCIGLHGLGGPSNNTMNHTTNGGIIAGLTDTQARTQMSLWCMLASPLALTCDLRAVPQGEANDKIEMPETLITDSDIATLTNAEMIAINQDALGQQAEYMEQMSSGGADFSSTGYDIYVKDLSNHRIAVAITNRSSSDYVSITLPLSSLYLQPGRRHICRDVWNHRTTEIKDVLSTGIIEPCETKVFVLTPQ